MALLTLDDTYCVVRWGQRGHLVSVASILEEEVLDFLRDLSQMHLKPTRRYVL